MKRYQELLTWGKQMLDIAHEEGKNSGDNGYRRLRISEEYDNILKNHISPAVMREEISEARGKQLEHWLDSYAANYTY